jgi:hypothetical protein
MILHWYLDPTLRGKREREKEREREGEGEKGDGGREI